MLDRELRLEAVALAARAPSPHNIQPARWRFDDARVELWEDSSRWLATGDPSGRDNRIAVGMAWEGMAITLSRHGWRLMAPDFAAAPYPPQAALRLIASGALERDAVPDALHAALSTRATWRGEFAGADAASTTALDAVIARHAPLANTLPADAMDTVARLFDEAAAEALRSPAFARELHHWMRFSRRDPRWVRDGLAADCMGLSAIESVAASVLMKPSALRVLSALSLTKALVGEGGKIRSATRLVAISRAAGEDVFDAGRAWYRFWLELDRAGFAAVPMSALSDSPAHARALLERWPLDAGRVLLNLMRIGPTPARVPRSARVPADELLLDD